jgi:hypothetical protein
MFNVRPLKPGDYENILLGWWADWNWTPPQKDFLPADGTGGLIIFDKKTPVCAGFVYVTNSAVTWVDWIISNREYRKKPQRQEALQLLIESLTNISKASGAKYAYALIKHPSLMGTYQNAGYIRGDAYTCEMIKTL